MYNFCTLFDSNYMAYGLTMYASLKKNCRDFHLFIFAFDEKVEVDLKKLALENVTVISLKDFEDAELLKIKPTRSKGEYCWTCTPSTILYVLSNFAVPSCTYVDADLCFFSDPKILIEEVGEKSVSIISHRYSKDCDQNETSGKYCVQFMTFKNNEKGLEVLNWWRDRCNEWCFAKAENGKFGDQKYLDDWLTRFDSVVELQNLGGGVAPWNVVQYDFVRDDAKIFGVEKESKKKFELIFFHFHGFKLLEGDRACLTVGRYKISRNVRELIYKEYVRSFFANSGRKLTRKKPLFSFVKNNKINLASWLT